jgi:predicted Zn-dependent protease
VKASTVADAALEAAGSDAEAIVHVERSGLARFAGSEVHQPTLIDNVVVTLRVVRNERFGAATTNKVDEPGIAELARRARDAAESAPPDETFPGLASPAEIPHVEGYDDETAQLSPDDQARLAATAIDATADVPAYGLFTSAVTELAVASSTGVSASQRMTDATVRVVAADAERSGYAERTSWRASDLDPAAVAEAAVETARRTTASTEIEPGEHAGVLEPYAFGELLESFAYDSFGALGLLEERSYLTGRLGEQIFDERISIADDSLDARGLPKAFDFEGTPKRRVQLIEGGVERGVVWDRTTAARAGNGARSTGHAPPVDAFTSAPLPYALSVAPGDAGCVAELADLVGDGIYITRLHYLGVVHPREGVITGMTRDGTFRIREGKIAEPLVNLRFTVSVPQLLRRVYALTRAVELVSSQDFYGARYPRGVLCPALACGHFAITGLGSKPGI